jgi:cytochrome c
MRWMRAGLLGGAVVFTASLLLARTHPFGNAALHMTETGSPAILEDSSVPLEVRAILVAKCADCHSMRVQLPLYDRFASRFAPASWLMERDIVEGRRHLNLSLWNNYTADEQESLKGLIVEEVKTGDMPPLQYRMIHVNARITVGDVAALKRWTRPMPVVEGALIGQAAGEGDPGRGEALFKRCTGCHSLDQNREGPRLRNVYGRTSGSVADYDYSAALKKAAIVWDDAALDRWLSGPDALVPGNNMDFEVDNAQDRRDLISYLKKSAGK